jgi:hypothetical protein
MTKSTQLKMVFCSLTLVSLFSTRPASAQESSPCSGEEDFFTCKFNPGPNTVRVDFSGNHSFKWILTATQPFFLQIEARTITCPGPQSRYPDPTEVAIPYVNATATTLGSCVRYDVTPFDATGPGGSRGNVIAPDQEHLYFSGQVHYRVLYNFPTLSNPSFDNPRFLRAICTPPFTAASFDACTTPFFDLTDAVFPDLHAGDDPGVDGVDDGFSQHIIVQQPHGNAFAGCLSPVDCSRPTDPSANVFKAGQTIPVKVLLSPSNPQADIRLSFTDPGGRPHLAVSSGNSNQDNKFRPAGNHFEFDWSTKGLAPGVYKLTITPGTNSGNLFAPFSFLVTLQ